MRPMPKDGHSEKPLRSERPQVPVFAQENLYYVGSAHSSVLDQQGKTTRIDWIRISVAVL
jgi:hypothetical protein